MPSQTGSPRILMNIRMIRTRRRSPTSLRAYTPSRREGSPMTSRLQNEISSHLRIGEREVISVKRATLTVLMLVAVFTPMSAAEIIGESGKYMAPPDTLGIYEMTPFPLDERPIGHLVWDVPSPLGGSVDFSIPLRHWRNGQGWSDWGHGYEGDGGVT